MRNLLATAILIASALFTGWTSWTSFRAPAQFARQLGYVVAGIDGRNEIRAQYGGFFLAVAVASVLTLAGVIPRQAGLLVNAVVFGALSLAA